LTVLSELRSAKACLQHPFAWHNNLIACNVEIRDWEAPNVVPKMVNAGLPLCDGDRHWLQKEKGDVHTSGLAYPSHIRGSMHSPSAAPGWHTATQTLKPYPPLTAY
jgi:hypothetical protein